MPPVALTGVQPVPQPVNDCPGDIEDGNAHHHEHHGDARPRDETQRSQHVTQHKRAVAAHVRPRGMDVEDEKAQRRAE